MLGYTLRTIFSLTLMNAFLLTTCSIEASVLVKNSPRQLSTLSSRVVKKASRLSVQKLNHQSKLRAGFNNFVIPQNVTSDNDRDIDSTSRKEHIRRGNAYSWYGEDTYIYGGFNIQSTADFYYKAGDDTQYMLDNLKSGDIIYVQASGDGSNNYIHFEKNALPYIDVPFVLAIGNTESLSLPSELPNSKGFAYLLDNPKLLAVFLMNYDRTISHDKIEGFPLGVNFMSLHKDRPNGVSYRRQELQLQQIEKSAVPARDRIPKVFYDAHLGPTDSRWRKQENRDLLSKYTKGEMWSREQINSRLKHNDWFYSQPSKMPRLDQWRERTKYAFTISPIGNGLDCHRTWESLILGQIVIVQRGPLDPLYEGLPVVQVDDWTEINQDKLDFWLDQYGDVTMDPRYRQKLYAKYWYNRLHRFKES